MRFLVVRTEIRAAAADDLTAAWSDGGPLRDEKTSPEPRRQVVRADNLDAALLLARALSTVGAVRSGRQRVKVVPVGAPERAATLDGRAAPPVSYHPKPVPTVRPRPGAQSRFT